ncbi:MAG TPA: DcrB-related protein [Thermomicrobiales bacterium]
MIRHRWWKLLVMVSLLGLCAVTAVGAQGTTYTDPNGRYSFTVPSGWQPSPAPQTGSVPPGTAIGGVFTAPAPLNGNFNVVTVTVPSGVPLDQIVTQSRDNVAKSLPGYQEGPGGIQNLTLAGQPARRYDYFLTPPQGSRLHGAQVIALQGNAVFVLTFTAAENDFNTFFQQGAPALSSFTFIGTGGATAAPTTTALPNTGMPHSLPQYGAGESLALLAGATLILGGLTLRRRYRGA